ncbi:Cytochrome c oxidase assembly protein cox11, mitochondrial [Nowakowskiella sp. JEL0407]|nr:Cytochrome c oxidase assembly protein cox11, mitochondrial [Nowakowskiella sp. JEL0407]
MNFVRPLGISTFTSRRSSFFLTSLRNNFSPSATTSSLALKKITFRPFASHSVTSPLNPQQQRMQDTYTVVNYSLSVIIVFLGLSYAAVPLYKIICTNTGLDGTPITAPGHKFDKKSMKPVEGAAKIRIKFDSSISDSLTSVWKFTPQTREMYVRPGETALAFYVAENMSDKDVVGISTYSVIPPRAAQYFNKIQCFCFEEQKLDAGEEVDMPVFFYIDPEIVDDPWLKDVKEITLSYTFFKSKHQTLR